jgi:hypothetical protein
MFTRHICRLVQRFQLPTHATFDTSMYGATISFPGWPQLAAGGGGGVESGKFMYPTTFGHVPSCLYMSYRPSEPFHLSHG